MTAARSVACPSVLEWRDELLPFAAFCGSSWPSPASARTKVEVRFKFQLNSILRLVYDLHQIATCRSWFNVTSMSLFCCRGHQGGSTTGRLSIPIFGDGSVNSIPGGGILKLR